MTPFHLRELVTTSARRQRDVSSRPAPEVPPPRHQFSLEQARKAGDLQRLPYRPDHPQWEIYQESPHGIAYATMGHTWNWEAEAGTLEVSDFPAPTCAVP